MDARSLCCPSQVCTPLFVNPPSAIATGVHLGSSFTRNNAAVSKANKRVILAPSNPFNVMRSSLVTDLFVKSVEAATVAAVSQQFITPQKGSSVPAGKRVRRERLLTLDSDASLETMVPNAIPAANELLRAANSVANSLQTVDGRRKWTKLSVCILIDLIGSGGLGIPFVSDFLDIITAPISAFALHALFGNPGVTIGGFVEEILPGTDGIPTATLAWFAEQNGYLLPPSSDDSESAGD